MERVLDKMAKQLNAYDEASLCISGISMRSGRRSLSQANSGKKVIALCLIQAVRWKNQLFNYNLANESNMASAPEKPCR